jgi:sugar phosphate permease
MRMELERGQELLVFKKVEANYQLIQSILFLLCFLGFLLYYFLRLNQTFVTFQFASPMT